MLQSTMEGYVAPKNMMNDNHPKALKIDRLFFERLVLDLEPFNMVNKPGCLRLFYELAPNYKVSMNST